MRFEQKKHNSKDSCLAGHDGCLPKPPRIHVWYMYLHEWLIYGKSVGKYTSPMDPMEMQNQFNDLFFLERFDPNNVVDR